MRMTYKAGLLIVLTACLLAQPAMAQDSENDQNTHLMQFAANNEAFDGRVEDTARDLFKRMIPDCGAIEQTVRQLPTRFGRMTFPKATVENRFPPPVYGVWAEHVKIKACNKIWTINMLGVSRTHGEPLLLAILPGDTLADPAAQHDAERVGSITIKKADSESCADDPHPTYTRMLGYKQADGTVGKMNAMQGWFEEWDYRFCQKTVSVQMAFLPNAKGTYDIKARVVPAATTKTPETKPDTSKPETASPAAAVTPATPATTPDASGKPLATPQGEKSVPEATPAPDTTPAVPTTTAPSATAPAPTPAPATPVAPATEKAPVEPTKPVSPEAGLQPSE